MAPYDQLTWFSIILIALWTGTILIPYLMGRSHLFCLWNFFLLGSVFFVGLSNLAFTLEWDIPLSTYNNWEIHELMVALLIFYATAYVFYYFAPFSQSITGRTLLVWPKTNRRTLSAFAIFCVGLTLFVYLPIHIPVISQLAKHFGIKATGFAITMIFIAWYKDRANPFLTTLFAGFVIYSLVFSVTLGGGRLTFISTIAGIPLGWYWLRFRKASKLYTLFVFFLLAIVMGLVIAAYGNLRHRGRSSAGAAKRDFRYAIETIKMLPQTFLKGDGKQILGQHSTEFALMVRRVYKNRPEPFAMGYYVLVNPIPRSLWKNKPVGLGYALPKMARARTRATWGPNVVGHAFHEGSLWFLVLYGAPFAMFLRYMDEWMARQPENPLLIGTHVAIFPHVLGWVRGDCGTFTIQIIAGLLTAFLIYVLIWLYRQGQTISYPRTENLSMWQIIRRDREQNQHMADAFFELQKRMRAHF